MELNPATTYEQHKSWLDRPLFSVVVLNWETVLFMVLMVAAVFTRFYMLGDRVMSHDETSHTYFSWLLFQGRGYQHDPITHGPFQFHIVALSYFLFGDNDFSARIPAALFGVASVAFAWYYRRYLGRVGAFLAALFLTISPYILYYSRYVRNESFIAFYGLVGLWAIMRYLEVGAKKYLYLLTAMVVMHFASKETAYIYTAQMLLFFAFYFIYKVVGNPWVDKVYRTRFVQCIIGGLVLFSGAALVKIIEGMPASAAPTPQIPGTVVNSTPTILMLILAVLGIVAFAASVFYLVRGYTLPRIRAERSFDLLMLVGVLVLPLLTAFPLSFVHWTVPTNATSVNAMTITDMVKMGSVLGLMFLVAILIGIWWNANLFWKNFALFYGVFVVLYTTVFTNGAGFFTGMLGSLGYWLAQQAVNRGSQPWYYYALVQIPMYEYLPALGSILALALAILGRRPKIPAEPDQAANGPVDPPETAILEPDLEQGAHEIGEEVVGEAVEIEPILKPGMVDTPPVLSLLGFWAVTSLIAFSIAGEKMPWLTVHITLAMILLAGWAVGSVIETTDWKKLLSTRGLIVIVLLPIFVASLAASLSSLLGTNPPFQGKNLDQLAATSTFFTGFLAMVVSGAGLVYLLKNWRASQIGHILILASFSLLTILTVHSSVLANYINFNDATEYLVYAHCGPGIKDALAQIEELSIRTTGGLSMAVAYDNETTYPYWWYLRDFTDQHYYGTSPTRDLRNVPVILVGDPNYGKIEPIVGQAYYMFQYIRIWWPNQDYFSLTPDRLLYALTNPQMRSAIFQIWLNHSYTEYGQATNKDMSLTNWSPSSTFRLYIRKDMVAKLWNYGSTAAPATVAADPYEGKQLKISADKLIGTQGSAQSQMTTPHDLAVAPDGSIYVADAGNNRIEHFSAEGTFISTWGVYGAANGTIAAAPSTFNDPWGIAVGPDGSVYVSDTWNNRVQKFTAKGDFVKQWGVSGQADTPFALYGPRGIAVDAQGHVYLADTGNKRIVIYDSDGNSISQFGSVGSDPGQFNEPVGVAVDSSGKVYIADTWNQRVQVMQPDGAGGYSPYKSWDIAGWYGQSLENKPYIAVDNQGHVFVTDPEGYRVLEFDDQGQFIQFWGDSGSGPDGFNILEGIVADKSDSIWIADSGNNRIMHFSLPAQSK
jgi:predicted membrane-bound mannosyltransferase/DNA-binding beta-propeller fold protein YncE